MFLNLLWLADCEDIIINYCYSNNNYCLIIAFFITVALQIIISGMNSLIIIYITDYVHVMANKYINSQC